MLLIFFFFADSADPSGPSDRLFVNNANHGWILMNGIVTDSTAWVYGIYLNIMEIYIKKKKVNKTNNSKSTRKPSLPCLYDCFYPPIFPSTSSEVAAVVFVIPESVFFKLTTYFILFYFCLSNQTSPQNNQTENWHFIISIIFRLILTQTPSISYWQVLAVRPVTSVAHKHALVSFLLAFTSARWILPYWEV